MTFRVVVVVVIIAAVLPSLPTFGLRAEQYKVLHNFGSGSDGAGPYGPLVFDGKGNLYGVTGSGGTGQCSDYGCGTVFELTPESDGKWREAVLYNFTAGNDGAFPWGTLIPVTGNLYGTVKGDVGFAVGGVFELSPSSGGWNSTVIYNNFAGPGLLVDSLGNLYGDMTPGQYKYYDAVAELSPSSDGWNYMPLYSFCGQNGCPDGWSLPAPPIWDGKGNMFGTTLYGGVGQPACWISYGCGVVFEMTPKSDGNWTYTVLHRFLQFSKKDGQTPNGGLVIDSSGDFYGTTALGGKYRNGMLFKLSHSSGDWRLTAVYQFPNCKMGCGPNGTMVFDKAGNLYGIGGGGLTDCGPDQCGVIFKLSPQRNGKWNYNVVHKFTGKDGGFPGYGLIIDDKQNLFGVTSSFGKYGYGVAFELTTETLIDDQHGVTLGYKSLEVYHPGSLYAADGLAVAPAVRNNSITPTDLTGTVTLDTFGHFSYTFQGTYSATNPPACGCWDAQDVTKTCTVAVSNTSLSFTGTAVHPVAFICAGHN